MAETQTERPHIERVAGKLAQLERMVEYRESQLSAGEFRGNGHFLKAEISALGAACDALRWHRAEAEGLDTPILALQEVVDAFRGSDGGAAGVENMAAAVARAEKVLAEWDS